MRTNKIIKRLRHGLRLNGILGVDPKGANWPLSGDLSVLSRSNQIIMPSRNSTHVGNIEGRGQVSRQVIDQLTTTNARLEQRRDVPLFKRCFRYEMRRPVYKPLESSALRDNTLCQFGWGLAARTYFRQMRRGNGVEFLVDFSNSLSQPL